MYAEKTSTQLCKFYNVFSSVVPILLNHYGPFEILRNNKRAGPRISGYTFPTHLLIQPTKLIVNNPIAISEELVESEILSSQVARSVDRLERAA